MAVKYYLRFHKQWHIISQGNMLDSVSKKMLMSDFFINIIRNTKNISINLRSQINILMIPFPIEIEWQNIPVSLLAEQLDNLADEEGFIRFDVRCEQRRAVIFVSIEEQPLPHVISPDLESYFEVLHNTRPPGAFSFDEIFTEGEVERIGKAIRGHFSASHFSSAAQTLLV